MGMSYDGREIVEEGGRVTITGVPYEAGCEVDVHVALASRPATDARPDSLSAEEWIARMHRVAKEIHALHPNAPVLTEHETSRESIYGDERGL